MQNADILREAKTEAALATLDEAVRSAIREIIEEAIWPKTKCIGNNAYLLVDETLAYKRVLILENANGIPLDHEDNDCYGMHLIWQREYNRYCMYGELEDFLSEEKTPVALTFESARVEIVVYDACSNSAIAENPWDWLQSICIPIAEKADLSLDYCNEKEKDLLPLIREIAYLGYYRWFCKQEYCSFQELKAMSARYGYQKAEKLLGKLGKTPFDKYEFRETAQRLVAYLCKPQCQPMWREIYQILLDSQEMYPDKADTYIDQESLAEIRRSIQTKMEARGYYGTYPDFVKTGSMPGIHLENSYNMTYWVGMEKRVQYHIHCMENYAEDYYTTIQFLCGTAFLKKEETGTDIYDCLFNAKGRRLFHTVHHSIPLPDNADGESDNLDMSITLAVKKAECHKLNKVEKKAYHGIMIPGWSLFWRIFLIMGGFFGVAMTLAMMVLWIIDSLVEGTGSSISEILMGFPWLLILAVGWIGFGGIMGIVTVLARRK